MARARETCKLDDSYFEFVEDKLPPQVPSERRQHPLKNIRKIDQIRNLIHSGDLGTSQICKDCEVNVLSVYRNLIAKLESNIRAYEREYKLIKTQKLNTTSSNPKETMKNTIAANTAELQTFTTIANRVTKSLNDYFDEREALERSIDTELREISSYQHKFKMVNEELSDLLTVANATYFEMNKLSRFRSSLLFNIITLSASNINNPKYEFGEINGFRLNFMPVPQANLNWAEINAAWATIALAIVVAQNRMRLSQYLFSYGLQPQRNRCYLFRRTFGAAQDTQSKVRRHTDVVKSVLCLEGGRIDYNSNVIPLSSQSNPNKSVENDSEYNLAVFSLALVLRQTLSALARDRSLPPKSILGAINTPEDAETFAADKWSDKKKYQFVNEVLTMTSTVLETRNY